MSERGTFIVDRGLFGHPVFADEPFTEREAWLWLISQAAFKSHERRVGRVRVQLVRGQLAHACRFMAEAWQWSDASVRRFLTKLAAEEMIALRNDAGVTQITICNYEAYQRSPDEGDAEVTQTRRKEEVTEVSKKEGVESARAREPRSMISPEAHQVADECRRVVQSENDDFCGLEYQAQAWLSKGHDPPLIVAAFVSAVGRYGGDKPLSYLTKAVEGALAHRAPPGQREMPLLKVVEGRHAAGQARTNSTSRSALSGADAILAGVGNYAAKRDEARRAAPSEQRAIPDHRHAAGAVDAT